MKTIPTTIPDVLIIEPQVFGDERRQLPALHCLLSVGAVGQDYTKRSFGQVSTGESFDLLQIQIH